MPTRAPSEANRRAIARPMPREAPVTSAVFPCRSSIKFSSLLRDKTRHLSILSHQGPFTTEKKYLASLCIRVLVRRSLDTRNRKSRVLCLQVPIVGYGIEGMFLKEDQDVALIADLIDFSDGRGKILHH